MPGYHHGVNRSYQHNNYGWNRGYNQSYRYRGYNNGFNNLGYQAVIVPSVYNPLNSVCYPTYGGIVCQPNVYASTYQYGYRGQYPAYGYSF